MKAANLATLLSDIESGLTQREAAERQGISFRQASKIIATGMCPEKTINDKAMQSFGCTWDQANEIPAKVRIQYSAHRSNARKRGVEWKFTLPAWWAAWESSNLYELRGQGSGYCMGRINDTGPYAPENIYICTCAQNTTDAAMFAKLAKDKKLSQAPIENQ